MGCDISIKDITIVNKVIVIGTTIHKFKNSKGYDVYIPCVSYHTPTSEICLFSIQTYHNIHSGNSRFCSDRVDIHFSKHKVVVPIYRKGSNTILFLTPQ